MSDTPPTVPYWHLYVDDEGISRQRRCHLTDFEMSAISPGATPQWNGRDHAAAATVKVVVLPPGWEGGWHRNPAPQWIVPLSGRWSVESMDGTVIEMGLGDISFGEDQDAVGPDERTGHGSRTVGDQPAVLMLVQFDEPIARDADCPFS